MDTINLLLHVVEFVIIVIGALLLKSYLPTYFAEKGKNLATKEDIKDITEKVEAVRAEYVKRQHVHEMAFDKEFEILSEVWGRLVDLRNATQSLRPVLDSFDPNEPEEERRRKRLQKFAECYNAFVNTVQKNQPFYPKEIYESLFEIMMIASVEAGEYSFHDPDRRPLDHQYWEEALNNQGRIIKMVDDVCEQIRERITT